MLSHSLTCSAAPHIDLPPHFGSKERTGSTIYTPHSSSPLRCLVLVYFADVRQPDDYNKSEGPITAISTLSAFGLALVNGIEHHALHAGTGELHGSPVNVHHDLEATSLINQ
jgi:hypothetical protein